MLKKTNAIISLLMILILLGHLGTMSYSMLTGWYNYSVCKGLAHGTVSIAIVHITISLIIVFFINDGALFKKYAKYNIKTIIQRATGLIIIALVHLHIKAFGFIVTGKALSLGNKTELLITEIAFFSAIFAHLAVSIPKAFISLGFVREEKTEKIVEKIFYVVCLILSIVTIGAILSFVVSWKGFAG